MTTHVTATREKWLEARLDLLAAEKDLMRRSDDVARLRQRLPWVPVDKGVCLRRARWPANARRLVRRPPPAPGAALHAQAGRGSRLQGVLLHGRPRRRHDRAPGASRRYLRRNLARAAQRDRALSSAHGLAVQMGVLVRHRLQL